MNTVLQIGKGWFPEESGGLNRYFYECAQHLPNEQTCFEGLVAGSAQVYPTSQQHVHSFGSSKSSLFSRWKMLRKSFYQLQQSHQYDLIASHFALYTFPVLDLIKQPLIIHFHGPWATEGRAEGNDSITTFFKKYIEKQVYRKAKHFIVLSDAFKQILRHQYGIPDEKISVVPGGVDLQRFNCSIEQADARQTLGWPSDRIVILAVRRLAKRMGLEQLIRAIAHLRHQYPNLLLLIAGKGTLAKSLEDQINELGLQEHVQLLGYVEDGQLPICYRAANFSIVPTQSLEGFGLILLESLASGTPVLGSPVGGIPEVLTPLSSDLVLPGSQVPDIAMGIQEVLTGVRVLPTAEQCRDYVEQNYSWTSVADKLRSVYSRVQVG